MYDVLIIDDERLIAEGVKAKLERAGLQEISGIHVACGGELGLRAAAELKPHIVITDIRMPDIDGVQGSIRLFREAFKYGLLDYLLKPAGSAELAERIRTAIAAIQEDARQDALANKACRRNIWRSPRD